jgi:hypothetical protein
VKVSPMILLCLIKLSTASRSDEIRQPHNRESGQKSRMQKFIAPSIKMKEKDIHISCIHKIFMYLVRYSCTVLYFMFVICLIQNVSKRAVFEGFSKISFGNLDLSKFGSFITLFSCILYANFSWHPPQILYLNSEGFFLHIKRLRKQNVW